MKNLTNYFLLPLAAMCVIAYALHTFIPYSHVINLDMCNNLETNITFALLGFLFGFLPCLISAMAKDALKPVAADPIHQPEPVMYVGQVFHSTAANCQFRVKSLKNASHNFN